MLLATNPGERLSANQSGYRSAYPLIPANTPPGNYHVLFVADSLSEESETNENNNNIAALPVAVTQAPTSHEQTASYTASSVMPDPVASGSGGALRVQLSGTGLRCAAALDLSMALGQRVRSQALLLGVGRANQDEGTAQNLLTGVYFLRLTGAGLSATRYVRIE